MEIYLATGNEHKVKELTKMLIGSGLDVGVHNADALGGMPEVEETEMTFEGNARLKAQALKRIAPPKAWVLGDDSGIAVDALNGAPGVFSARYAHPNASDVENYMKLLGELSGVPDEERTAQFVCCFVLLHESIGEMVFYGMVRGRITHQAQGSHGFGYDPIFIPNGYMKTCAQMDPSLKNRIGHRGLAVQQLIDWIESCEFGLA